MKMVRILTTLGITLIAASCASTATGPSVSTEESKAAFQSALDDAKAEYKKADATGYAWRDTSEMIKEAEKAMKDGDADKAMKLVAQAKKQSVMAIEQAARAEKADMTIPD